METLQAASTTISSILNHDCVNTINYVLPEIDQQPFTGGRRAAVHNSVWESINSLPRKAVVALSRH